MGRSYDITYLWSLKYHTNQMHETKTHSQIQRAALCLWGWGGRDWELGVAEASIASGMEKEQAVLCSAGNAVNVLWQTMVKKYIYAISFPRGPSRPRDRTWISCIAGRRFTIWATLPCYIYIYIFIWISGSLCSTEEINTTLQRKFKNFNEFQ